MKSLSKCLAHAASRCRYPPSGNRLRKPGYPFNAGQLGYACRYSKIPGMPVTEGHDFSGLKSLWHLMSRLKRIPESLTPLIHGCLSQ